ncbi:hypothetical protein [Orbus mooreae]|uniref:hypothetical protein n=1 Tax=Orbus mooreae TaxID=3074107 RepID=UPI00370D6DF8
MKIEDKLLNNCSSVLMDIDNSVNEPINILERLVISAKQRSQGLSRSVDEVFDEILSNKNDGE